MMLRPWWHQMYSHTDLTAQMALQSNPKQVWLPRVWPCCHIQALEVPLRHWLCEILQLGHLELQSQLSVRCPGGAEPWQCSVKAAAMGSFSGQLPRGATWPPVGLGTVFCSGQLLWLFCVLAVLQDVGFNTFPFNLFPVAWVVLELHGVAESKGCASAES